MANGMYNGAVDGILAGSLDLVNDTIKVMLVKPGYSYDPDHLVVDNGANNSTDPSHNECDCTGYTGGYEGAGRETVTITKEKQDANNRVVFKIANVEFGELGGATNNEIGGAILIKEEAESDDTDTQLIAYFGFSDKNTNGSEVTLTFDATNGNIRFTVT